MAKKEMSQGQVFARVTIIVWLMCWYMACVNAVCAQQCEQTIQWHDCRPVDVTVNWEEINDIWVQYMIIGNVDWEYLQSERCISHYHLARFVYVKECEGSPFIVQSVGYTKWWYYQWYDQASLKVYLAPAELLSMRRGERHELPNSRMD